MPSALDGTPFAEFADIEHHAARLGIDPNGMELWEIACAFGAHRPHHPAYLGIPSKNIPGAKAHDSALAEMIASAERERASGSRQEWSEPTEAERIALRRLLN